MAGPDGAFHSLVAVRCGAGCRWFRTSRGCDSLGGTVIVCSHDRKSNDGGRGRAHPALSHLRIPRAGPAVAGRSLGLPQGFSVQGVINMKRFASIILLVISALLVTVSVFSQSSNSPWPFFLEVTPRASTAGIYEFVVPLQVMYKAK